MERQAKSWIAGVIMRWHPHLMADGTPMRELVESAYANAWIVAQEMGAAMDYNIACKGVYRLSYDMGFTRPGEGRKWARREQTGKDFSSAVRFGYVGLRKPLRRERAEAFFSK